MRILRRIALFIPSLLLFVVVLGLVGLWAVQLPVVQTALVQRVSTYLSQKLGMEVRVGGVNIEFFDKISLSNVHLHDHHQEPLIDVEELVIDFKLANLQDTNGISLDRVKLVRPHVVMAQYEGENQYNIDEFVARINKLTASGDSTHTVPKPFRIDEAEIIDGTYAMHDYRKVGMREKRPVFDYNHFTFNDLNANITDFKLLGGDVSLKIRNMRAYEKKADLRIKKLNTNFEYTAKHLLFDKLLARINNSQIQHFVELKYDSIRDLGYFNEKVTIVADFDSTVIATTDLGRFAPGMYAFNDRYKLYGQLRGKVIDLQLNKADVAFGERSRLRGNFAFVGLPEVEQMKMDFAMNSTTLNATDLEQYAGKSAVKSLEKFGQITIDGSFVGKYNQFKTDAAYETALGKAYADLEMNLPQNLSDATYKGRVDMMEVDLGKLFDNKELLQKISLTGMVTGRGFDVATASIDLDAEAEHFGFKGYDYKNIYVNGHLQKGLFDGLVAVQDTNLVFDLQGRIDIRNNAERVDLSGRIKKANLQPLHLTKGDLTVESKLSLHFQGFNLDNMTGTGSFRDTYLSMNKKNLIIDSLFVNAWKMPDSTREVAVRSDILDATAKGKYDISRAITDMSTLLTEYQLYFLDNEQNRASYYARKMFTPVGNPYQVNYDVLLKNSKPLLAFLYPDGYISQRARLEGVFKAGNASQLNLVGSVDTLLLGNYRFYDSEFDVNTSKFFNNPEVLASAQIYSKNQKISALAPTEHLEVEAVWDNDHISFTSFLAQIGNSNQANLNGNLRFTAEGLALQFEKSKFKILGNEWAFNPQNQIRIAADTLVFKDVSIQNGPQFIGINGQLSADTTKALQLETRNFRLETLDPVLNIDLKGTVNGLVNVRDVYGKTNLDSRIKIDTLAYDKFLIGDLLSEGQWDKTQQRLNIDSYIDRLGTKILTLKGYYHPTRGDTALNLAAQLTRTRLEILNPFTKGIFSDLAGDASGLVKIQGGISKPILGGEIKIDKGRAKFDYLNTTWFFEDTIQFYESEIATRHLYIRDDEGNRAVLVGGVYHDGFEYITLQLKANLRNFKVLNTTARQNEMFYGTAYATGKVEVSGPLNNIAVKADMKSNRNTKIYIPLDGAADVGNTDYIEFVSFKKNSAADSLAKALSVVAENDLSGITMDFNFDITPDAVCEIQFDRQSGDVIKAQGNGLLNLRADTKSDFTMAGTYQIEKGDYTFTFQNILNKKFQIRPGSKISWAGDPYAANLDVKAVYTQNTSLYPIIDTAQIDKRNGNDAQYRRRYPVNLVLGLNDKLTSPRISYDLEIKDYPQSPVFNTAVTTFMSKIQTDEQELSRQVSSVLALGQLLPQNPSQIFTNDNIVNNLSELISNQISNWASQIDKNLQIDLNVPLNSLNQNLINNLQFRFSYNFNDRLRITRNGGFTNAQNQTDNLSLIGDWSLEWLITRDGTLRLKGYNRNIQNPFSSLSNASVTTTTGGASMLYTQSFDHLFPKKKKKIGLVAADTGGIMP